MVLVAFSAGWIRVVLILAGSFFPRTLYRGPRGYPAGRLRAPWASRRLSFWPAWLWLRWESAVAAGDRIGGLCSGKLDDWGGLLTTAVARTLSRAVAPVGRVAGAWARHLAGWAVRLYQGQDGRWRRSRLASKPPVCQMLVVVLALAVVLVPYQLLWGKNALAVSVGGRVIGQVADRSEVWFALRQVEQNNARLYGRPVEPMAAIGLVRVHSDAPPLTGDELAWALDRYVRFGVPAGGISINGRVGIVLANVAAAEKTLRDFAAQYQGGQEKVYFKEGETIVPVTVPPQDVVSESGALALLESPVVKPAVYTVRNGDTLWQLARSFHTTVNALAADNPGMNVNRLGVGEVINLDRVDQLANVLTTYVATSEEADPYPVEWQKDSNLYYWRTDVVQRGRPGREEVVALVTEEDGRQINRQVLSRRVLQAPVPEIERGGDVGPASRGADYHRLIWPAAGPIASPFGWRTIFGRREFHTGIDIGAPYGAPIVAAAPGVVTFTGWESGYGRTVTVSHGDGVSTLYAHMSESLVHEGEVVGQGQELGRIGETGHATGPHVHFEVREDGTPVNPMDFL